MRRSEMTRQEREWRSELKQYIAYLELLKGSLTLRRHTCGKGNCKCAGGGYKHRSLYLTGRRKRKVEQLYVGKDREKLAREWTRNYRVVQGLLEKISSVYWDRLNKKEE